MRLSSRAGIDGLAATANAASLADVCTVANIQAALPTNGTLLGINLITSSVTASAVYNATTGGGMMKRQSTTTSSEIYTYCNVTFSFTHTDKSDSVTLKLTFPQRSNYKNRYYVAGGGGFSLSSDAIGGLKYDAAGAATCAGYDAFRYSYGEKVLYGNGSINWDATYEFSYQASGEMTEVVKAILPGFYGTTNSTKIYTYYEGCSDEGRKGMGQVQRWGEEYYGLITGAPAFRSAQQQVLHVYPATIEHTMDYYRVPCALDKIVNATVAACDLLDGRADGVISRTDLCKLNFNLSSIIGESYYCAAQTSTSLGFGFSRKREAAGSQASYQPAQNGTITAQDVAVAQAVYDGLHNSAGERAYLSWQIGSDLSDADTTYSNTTGSWGLSIPSTGGEYGTEFIQLLDLSDLSDLEGVTYDTVVDWMNTGMVHYLDFLQTTLPDLTPFQSSGGKLLH